MVIERVPNKEKRSKPDTAVLRVRLQSHGEGVRHREAVGERRQHLRRHRVSRPQRRGVRGAPPRFDTNHLRAPHS